MCAGQGVYGKSVYLFLNFVYFLRAVLGLVNSFKKKGMKLCVQTCIWSLGCVVKVKRKQVRGRIVESNPLCVKKVFIYVNQFMQKWYEGCPSRNRGEGSIHVSNYVILDVWIFHSMNVSPLYLCNANWNEERSDNFIFFFIYLLYEYKTIIFCWQYV